MKQQKKHQNHIDQDEPLLQHDRDHISNQALIEKMGSEQQPSSKNSRDGINSGMGGESKEGMERPNGWGTPLASFQGVTAYSNGGVSSYWERGVTNYGLAYQCVEYVNRFSSKVHGTSNMAGSGNAIDYAGKGHERFGFHWIPNEAGNPLPEAGDLMVFGGGSYGHVAIATGSSGSGVGIIQQNTSSATGTLSLTGNEGEKTIAKWGKHNILGWHHAGSLPQGTVVQEQASNTNSQNGNTTENGIYIVKSGDTLYGIAQKTLGDGSRYPEIASWNNLQNPNQLRVGQELKILDGSGTSSTDTKNNTKNDTKDKTDTTTKIPEALVCLAPKSQAQSTAKSQNSLWDIPLYLRRFLRGDVDQKSSMPQKEQQRPNFDWDLSTKDTITTPSNSTSSQQPNNQKHTYVVKKGDSLWNIAANELGDGYRYLEIADINQLSNPSQIEVGQELLMPTT